MGVAIQSPPFPPLSPESPHLWEGMGEFSSCQRHFWTMCIRKRNWRGTSCPVGIAPAAKHPQHPSEEWIQVRHQDFPFHWPPHWSQDALLFLEEPRIALQVGWPLYEIADCPHAQQVSPELCSYGVFLTVLWCKGFSFCFMTQPLLEIFFLMGTLFSLWGSEEGRLSYKQKSCCQSSLPDSAVISYYSKMYAEDLIRAKLADISTHFISLDYPYLLGHPHEAYVTA